MTKLSRDQILDLELILEALYQSEPKAKQYVEPMERHTRAIQKLIAILNAVGPDKEVPVNQAGLRNVSRRPSVPAGDPEFEDLWVEAGFDVKP